MKLLNTLGIWTAAILPALLLINEMDTSLRVTPSATSCTCTQHDRYGNTHVFIGELQP